MNCTTCSGTGRARNAGVVGLEEDCPACQPPGADEVTELVELHASSGNGEQPPSLPKGSDISGYTLAEVHAAYRKWFGKDYDLGALDAVLATAAAEWLTGDPPWLLVVGGSGATKTETIVPLAGAGAEIVSTLSGEAALLSGTSEKEKAKDSHGGLLRKLGKRGILVVKDVTSILSMHRDTRAEILAALREVYDGKWSREVGTDGGRTLIWEGRVVVVGAVTTAWDSAYSVVSMMGDRFVLVRMNSTDNRRAAGRQALGNVSNETKMREELSDKVQGLLAHVDDDGVDLTDAEKDAVVDVADLVTLARTAVERSYSGDVLWPHAPEMPTRFAKQLAQIVRGGIALGMARADALAVAVRCAGDTMPPIRLKVLDDVCGHPRSLTSQVVKRLQLPRTTVDRVLQELHLLGLLILQAEEHGSSTRWIYSAAESVPINVVRSLVTRNVTPLLEDQP